MSHTPFKGRISSDKAALNELNASHPWIPNEHQIRPRKNILMIKQEKLASIGFQWRSLGDYIRHSVWGLQCQRDDDDGRLRVDEVPLEPAKLQPCEFPYDLDEGRHMVLWFNEECCSREEQEMTGLLDGLLSKHLGMEPAAYSFAWYVNPKVTVPDYFHLQVFVSPR